MEVKELEAELNRYRQALEIVALFHPGIVYQALHWPQNPLREDDPDECK